MKLWIKTLSVFLFISLIFLPKNTEAKSGCCSGHGGVSCSAGAQSNGNVICNDGWTGSSCSYSGMVMCGGSSTSTTTIQTVQPTSTPRPTLAPTRAPTKVPTNTPTTIPTNTLTPTLTSTPSPTETPIITPTIEPTKTEEISPTAQPQILGEADAKKPDEPVKTSDTILGFTILGLTGFGVYKLFVKIRNKIKELFTKK